MTNAEQILFDIIQSRGMVSLASASSYIDKNHDRRKTYKVKKIVENSSKLALYSDGGKGVLVGLI